MGAPLIDKKKVVTVANYFLKNQDDTIGSVCKKFKLSRPTIASIRSGDHKQLTASLSKRLSKKVIKKGRRPTQMSQENRNKYNGEINEMRKRLRELERDLVTFGKKIRK